MRKVDIIAGAVLAAFGIVFFWQSLSLDFYIEGVPGPGFFPALLGIGLVVTGGLLVATRLAKPAGAFEDFALPKRDLLRKSIGLWVALLASVALVQIVGFLAAMLLLVAVILLLIERMRGLKVIATIVLIPLLAYLLFGALLRVPLPAGIFGS